MNLDYFLSRQDQIQTQNLLLWYYVSSQSWYFNTLYQRKILNLQNRDFDADKFDEKHMYIRPMPILKKLFVSHLNGNPINHLCSFSFSILQNSISRETFASCCFARSYFNAVILVILLLMIPTYIYIFDTWWLKFWIYKCWLQIGKA